jgi:hypothetical protein
MEKRPIYAEENPKEPFYDKHGRDFNPDMNNDIHPVNNKFIDSFAILCLTFGICSLFTSIPAIANSFSYRHTLIENCMIAIIYNPMSIAGVLMGVISLRRVLRNKNMIPGKALAIAGIICALMAILIPIVFYLSGITLEQCVPVLKGGLRPGNFFLA